MAPLMALSLTGCSFVSAWESHTGPSEMTYAEGRLAACPDRPNCVSTQGSTPDHAIVPFTYAKPFFEAAIALQQELEKHPRAKLVKVDGPYFHFEFRSPVLRAIDDVEFIFDEQTKTLQFRSGSRFGYSDWNENRKRMEAIRNDILGKI